jgi:hypothetical protein
MACHKARDKRYLDMISISRKKRYQRVANVFLNLLLYLYDCGNVQACERDFCMVSEFPLHYNHESSNRVR